METRRYKLRISHKNKFVFLSKPKCASTTIRKKLDKYSDIISSGNQPYHHHTTALKLKIHFSKMGWDWNNYFKFITLRNPWDMLVSFYHYAKPDINGIYFWEEARAGIKRDPDNLIPFEQWVLSKDIKKSHHALLYKDGKFHENIWTNDFSFFTLNNFILDENGSSLVDYIVKVENLKKDLKIAFDEIGIPFRWIRKRNKSKHKHYKQYYSSETKKIIEKEFQYDIEIGEYEF
jgi:hypothetical protein